MSDKVKPRRQAMIGKVLVVEVDPGTKIFDLFTGKLVGMVLNGKAVPNGHTVYLTTDDYNAAKAALPAAPKKLPGLH